MRSGGMSLKDLPANSTVRRTMPVFWSFTWPTFALGRCNSSAAPLIQIRLERIKPINHGNAWSIYFKDPEDNSVEVFCDSPFHVAQPQAKPWDLTMTEDELRRHTEEQFGREPEFKPMKEFYAEHRRRIGD